MMCVDYLTAILVRLGRRRLDTSTRETSGQWRVRACDRTYSDFLADAFDEIRQNAEGSVAMLRHLRRSLETLSEVTAHQSRRHALRHQLEAVNEVIARTVESPRERDALGAYARRVSKGFNRGRPSRCGGWLPEARAPFATMGWRSVPAPGKGLA